MLTNTKRFIILCTSLVFCLHNLAWAHQNTEMNFPPLPKIKKPFIFLAPAGGYFNFVTCKKGDFVFSMAETTVPPGMGPLPHIHHYTNEWFYAPEGGFTIFASTQVFDDVRNPPSREKGTQTTAYLIPLDKKQTMYGPKFYTHGFINHYNITRPLTVIWIADPISPDFPYKDGGIREYFTAVSQKVDDINHLPAIRDENRKLLVSEAPKFGINQSSYFLQYINRIEPHLPANFHHPENMKDLHKILEAVKAYNAGSKEVSCY
jgi:hypothetical protein